MHVILTLRCLKDYIPKDMWSRKNQYKLDWFNMITEHIKIQAIESWNARPPNAIEVQFIYKMDENHFRLFTVKQKDENTLEVDY